MECGGSEGMNAGWNNGRNKEGMRSKLCQSPEGAEGMSKMYSVVDKSQKMAA